MDEDSARKANLLVGNEEDAPVLELLFTGARFRVLGAAEFSITGAAVASNRPQWRNFLGDVGEEISFGELRSGVWTYLAVQGGFAASRWFGSASVDPRAGFGAPLSTATLLRRLEKNDRPIVLSRFVPELVRERFDPMPAFQIWPGPEWEFFSPEVRARFLNEPWVVSTQSDRAGYRLQGAALAIKQVSMPSAPVIIGTIQLPPNGLPIVLLRDGPTVGGYPRVAILEPTEISRFTQCGPGTVLRFETVNDRH